MQPKGKTTLAEMSLNLINKLYCIELDQKAASNSERLAAVSNAASLLDQLKA